jgi:hypothetical protein
MSVLAQGEAYIKKKINKIDGMFASKQEGFSGILGPNAELEYVNQTDYAKTAVSVNNLNTNINAYQNATTALQNRTNLYLNSQTVPAPGDPKRNYNVFINKSVAVTATSPVSARTAGASAAGGGAGAASAAAADVGAQCVSLAALEDFADSSGNGFDNAYPENFSLFDDAKKACQIWAADLGFKFFGVTQQNAEFKCYTSNKPPRTTPKNFTSPKPLYTVATKLETTRGGLFANGQIGVYRSAKAAKWNIANMNKPLTIKKYNNPVYSSTDANQPRFPDSTLLRRWWGENGGDGRWIDNRNIGSNIFPNDKTAWWIGYDDPINLKTDADWLAKQANTWRITTPNKIYFYYLYNNTTSGSQTINIYMLLQPTLKVNGVNITLEREPGPGPLVSVGGEKSLRDGFTGIVTLNKGKNVFEIPRFTGFCNSGFMAYFYDSDRNILFRTGDPGWGVLPNPVPDWKMISNTTETPQTFADPYLFTTVNTEPNGFSTCDKLIGGNINIKTINATYGKNCSNSTKKPLNVRYIRFESNAMSQNIQISQLVVMAFLNGVQQNVAKKGTITSSPSFGNTDPLTPVNEKTDNILYWSSEGTKGDFWQLDLGVEFPVVSITFYNRTAYHDYADGMAIKFRDGKGNGYTFKNPVILTGQLVQTFSISIDDVIVASPWFKVGYPGATPSSIGYGVYSRDIASQMCAARGQRLCLKNELSLLDFCAAGWVADGQGYPMAHGGDGNNLRCGQDPSSPDFSYWTGWAGASGVYCCDIDHTGAYPASTIIQSEFTF